MGVITDFIVARADEADAILADGYPYSGREFFECKGLMSTDVEGVATALAKASGDEPSTTEFEEIVSSESGDQMVFLVPDEIRDRLAISTDDEIRAATAMLIDADVPPTNSIDEWRAMNSSAADAMLALAKLASHARVVGKSVLQYVSM